DLGSAHLALPILTRAFQAGTGARGACSGPRPKSGQFPCGQVLSARHYCSEGGRAMAQVDLEAAQTRRAARGGLANLIGAAYSGIASFVITAVVTRISSTEDAGIYFAALSILLITVALAQIGTPVGYVYFLARYRGLKETHKLRSVVSAGALPVLSVTTALIVIALVFHERLGHLLFGESVAEAGRIVVIIAGAVLIAIVAEGSLAATRGFGV